MISINKIVDIFMGLCPRFSNYKKNVQRKRYLKKCNLSFMRYKIRYELRNLYFISKF